MDDTLERYDSAVELPFENNKPEEEAMTTSPPPQAPHEEERSPGSITTSEQEPQQPNRPNQPSRLLSLPPELQLLIWESTVISPEPLHLNCPCDSSYGGWTDEYYTDQASWEAGEKEPPWQPSLTRVCRSIRADALPIFYKYNRFQAGYCYETDTEIVVDWLKVIGEENRKLMRGFYFWDANCRHDANCPKDLKRVQRSEVVRGMCGVLESEYGEEYCKHAVRFGVKGEDEELEGLEGLFESI
ncbi:hypothetical protein M409DRAFT_22031 [Zasmidium cellare ATCC 36951]|uniref:2EXR domain-containing protein n=1 Tax=Zasmidium cellare ATCC 36951 TaxID=1080233 RepID=A0A6A6CMN0_ZASCE|nr:uncharacterized protein M409DRAFT_22031 [Zasmidium cellare ATCC 36951]KAF2167883.1 hypothetical protein M409DRAFT_22031 [Zasmidium cellare ATCC 36951]